MSKAFRIKLLICLLLVVVFSTVFSIFMFNNFASNGNEKSLGYCYYINKAFSSENDYDYKNNTDFHILNETQLRYFGESIYNGCHFAGKNVYLDRDIEISNPIACLGMKIDSYKWAGNHSGSSFSGNFDGQNHTISNFNTKLTDLGSYGSPKMGLFRSVKTNGEDVTIQNLKIHQMKIESTVNRNAPDVYSVGSIAGYVETSGDNTVTIKNCFIDEFEIVIAEKDKNHYNGGLVGDVLHVNPDTKSAHLIISNCHVKDFSSSSQDYMRSIGPSISNISSDKYSSIDSYKAGNMFIIKDSISQNSGYPIYDVYSGESWAHDMNYESVSSVFNVPGKTSGLDFDGLCEDYSDSTWYYNADYNNGFPSLRQFMSWTYINVKTEESSATVNGLKSIEIPAPEGLETKYSSSTFLIEIFGTEVKASPEEFFKEWKIINAYNYVAVFNPIEFKLTFKSANNASTNVELGEYCIRANSRISVETLSYEMLGRYKMIAFVFTDVNNNTFRVQYTANSTHYISDTSVGTTGSFTVTGDVEISVNVELKTYDVIFK